MTPIRRTVGAPRRAVGLAVKRLIDVTASLLGLVLLSPVILAIGLAIRWTMGAPVFFRQIRPGLHGRPFTVVKFRTMTDQRDERGELVPDGERLTRLGRFLRKTSLDEITQLWNVLKGELSLVGPRPLLMQYLDRYTPEQMRRHEATPGITGWAQVNGRNLLTWEERFAYDVWYVDNWSLWLDVRILWKTLKVALSGTGVSSEGHATMAEFMGSKEGS